MKNQRQIAAYSIVILFMAVTIGHVANYAASFEPDGWTGLGWLYAIAVEGSIVMCAAFTLWKTTSRYAWAGYILGVVASGLLNIAQVTPWTRDWGAWVYAIFPTIAQALLGFLARDAGKFTKTRNDDERLRKARDELRLANARIEQINISHSQQMSENYTEFERVRTELEQACAFKRADRTIFETICAKMNGNAPTTPRGVNDLLNDNGYYAVPDSTARTWIK